MSSRVDEFGRAYAGSQLQIQTYVNRRQQELDTVILDALPELREGGASLQWVSPLEADKFIEYQDESFLAVLDLLEFAGELAQFWPQGGPKWDALAKIHWGNGRERGVLLVEAKSYAKESDWVFASDRAKGRKPRCSCSASKDYLRPAAVKAGVIAEGYTGRFGWHNLRHSLASFFADNEVNLPVIQTALRHAKPATTAKYIHRNNAVQIKVQSKFLEAIKVAKTAAVN